MTYIYLDNNVIINIEEGKLQLPPLADYAYPFSYVHIEELLESGDRLEKLKKTRLSTLSFLSRNHCLFNDESDKVSIINCTPMDVYNKCCTPIMRAINQAIKMRCSNTNDNNVIIKYFDIDKRVINNYTPEQLLAKHSDFIEHYVFSSSDENRLEAFNSFFNVMDLLGFWQDEKKAKSSLNRLYDAKHAYHATSCDLFITDDVKTRNKANVLYSYYGYKTKAISTKQLLEILNNASSDSIIG